MASFEKRGTLWSVRFRFLSESGEERHMRLSGYQTKKAAREAYEEYVAAHDFAQGRPRAPQTLRELAEAYLAYLGPTVKESSLYEVHGRLERHILPTFGEMKAEEVTPLQLVAWQNSIIERFSRSYLVSLRAAFTALWTYAMNFHEIKNNPWPKVRLPKDQSPPAEMSIWTPEQFGQFLDVVDLPEWRTFFRLLFLTGCRKGEALALGPSDVRGSSICISKSITRKASGPYAVTTPKTRGSIRRISIPADLADELRNLGGPFLFGGVAPWADRTVERYFKEWIAAAGVPPIRMHDLRHSHASFLISSGCSIVAVSKRLGHSSVKQTLDTYSHALEADEDEIQDVLQKVGTKVGTDYCTLMLKNG